MGRLIDADEVDDAIYKCFEGIQCYDGSGYDIYSDAKEIIDKIPTVEAIPKEQYENRLKADLKAILVELQLEIEEQCKIPNNCASAYDWNNGVYACYRLVHQKIRGLEKNQ